MKTILTSNEFIDLALAQSEKKFLGVIGFPISQSKSPILHNLSYKKSNISANYFAIEIKSETEFIDFVTATEKIDSVPGFNVTIPYKQILFQTFPNKKYSDLNAANTLLKIDNKWQTENSDWLGFLSPIKEKQFQSALILGSGGATSSVIYGLRKLNPEIKLTNISRRKIEQKGIEFVQSDYSSLMQKLGKTDLIINTTPLGMNSFPENFSHLFLDSLPESDYAYDLIYNPVKTKFLNYFEMKSCKIINGLEMFVEQASAANQLWFGSEFSNEVKTEFVSEILK